MRTRDRETERQTLLLPRNEEEKKKRREFRSKDKIIKDVISSTV